MQEEAVAGTGAGPRRGHVLVCVGLGTDSRHFMIKASFLDDANLLEYLEESEREYGFCNSGVLKIPCDAKRFTERMLVRVGTLAVP